MENDLPDDFDLVVVGTGMIESIVAAAASRIGKKVLHVDKNDYYGGVWASFNIEGVEKYVSKPQVVSTVDLCIHEKFIHEGEQLLQLGNDVCGISNATQKWHIPKETPKPVEEVTEDKTEETKTDGETTDEITEEKTPIEPKEIVEDNAWYQDKIMKQSRKFNIDLAPKLQFARGDFVELLISSNIARYSEYRSCSRVLTWLNGQLEIVPCSRSDVFSNTKVTVVEKRMLMKLLSECMDNDEQQFAEYENKKFLNYLKDKKLTPNLIHYVLYAISMSTNDTSCLDAIKNTKRFLNSLGRFGKTPFLYSMYGSGELPQAFCRLCAVFGGTYCLNRPVNSLILNSENKCISVMCGEQRINAGSFVVGLENIPKKFLIDSKEEKISRAIFITDKSIMPSEKENLTLLLFPPEAGKNPITVIELGPASGTCPPNLYLVHIYCKQTTNPEDDFKSCIDKLLKLSETTVENSDDLIPNILWSLYYTVTDRVIDDNNKGIPSNLFTCGGPDLDLDFDNSVRKAKEIFMRIYPESEFLPRAPDPEEIVLCDDEENDNKTNDLPVEKSEGTDDDNKTEENQQETN